MSALKILPSWIRLIFFAVFWVFLLHLFGTAVAHHAHLSLTEGMCRWDCSAWYKRIGETGYQLFHHEPLGPLPKVGMIDDFQVPYAFWPLFPVTTGFIAKMAQLSFLTTAAFLNGFYWACASVLAVYFFIPERCETQKYLFIALFLSFPYSFYCYVPYSESLYGLLLLLFLFLLSKDKILRAGVAGMVFSVARPTACLNIAVLYGVKFFLTLSRGIEKKTLNFWFETGRFAFSAVLSATGFFCWLLYQKITTGYWLEFLYAESAWDRSYSGVWHNLKDGFSPWHIHWHEIYQIGFRDPHLFALLGLFSLLIAAYALSKKLYLPAAVILITFWASFSHGYEGALRFLYSNPVTIGLICLFLSRIPRFFQILCLSLFVAGQLLLLNWWFSSPNFLT